MTIAACYVLPEGIVIGADSTTTTPVAAPTGAPSEHFYEHGQKIFEVGQGSALCIATWGLGGLGELSYRTMIAEFGDYLERRPPRSMAEVSRLWATRFWTPYISCQQVAQVLALKQAIGPNPDQGVLQGLALAAQQVAVGFCVAGRCAGSRLTEAYHLNFSPMLQAKPVPTKIIVGQLMWWGVPQLIQRLLLGVDAEVAAAILESGKWTGTQDELTGILKRGAISIPVLPIRDAADMLHALLHATIKVLKFSHLAPVCGGPIEIAAVTSDRPFRWIRHKALDAAIG